MTCDGLQDRPRLPDVGKLGLRDCPARPPGGPGETLGPCSWAPDRRTSSGYATCFNDRGGLARGARDDPELVQEGPRDASGRSLWGTRRPPIAPEGALRARNEPRENRCPTRLGAVVAA
eukprot:1364300-Pyramimonas_sp.AAC.1